MKQCLWPTNIFSKDNWIIYIKIIESSGTNNAAPCSVVDVLMGEKPPTILKTPTEKDKSLHYIMS